MASQQMKTVAAALKAARAHANPDASVAERRAAMESMQAGLTTPADVTVADVDCNGVAGRWICADTVDADRVVLYLHGGGYALGSLDTHQELMARLSRACGARVLGLDYRLAPENPYPAAVNDAIAGYDWLLDQGVRPANVMVGGDSAGGGLALSLLLTARDTGKPMPAGAILFSPWTDLTGTGASIASRADVDPMIDGSGLAAMAAMYHGTRSARDPNVSPVFADLDGLPPLLIQVGDAEILLDDATRIAANATLAGVAHELQIYDEAFHVFQAFPQLPEAAEALAKAGAFFAARVGGR